MLSIVQKCMRNNYWNDSIFSLKNSANNDKCDCSLKEVNDSDKNFQIKCKL